MARVGADAGGMLLVMRVPFLARIESLMRLVEHLAGCGQRVTVVSPVDERFPPPRFMAPGIVHVPVETRRAGGTRVPTTARLLALSLREARRTRPAYVVGSDQVAGIIGSALSRLFSVPYVYYCLEYPEPRGGGRSWRNRLERAAIRRAALGITFDEEHAAFIVAETGLARDRLLLLPNASGPRSAAPPAGGLLAAKHGFPPGSVVVLHSGGFGPWFNCRELAEAARRWPEPWRLVFHVSHDVSADPYAQGCRDVFVAGKVVFDAEPLPARELDGLVVSAQVGVALYSREILGFRAELMGQASGKIGRFLKNGVPVVAQNVPSIRRYVEGYGCGVCVDGAAEVEGAVARILADYGTFRANALRCYDEIWSPDRHCAVIAERLLRIGRG
jgi:glycosyltransferase involved in cell wall biosynthesis